MIHKTGKLSQFACMRERSEPFLSTFSSKTIEIYCQNRDNMRLFNAIFKHCVMMHFSFLVDIQHFFLILRSSSSKFLRLQLDLS